MLHIPSILATLVERVNNNNDDDDDNSGHVDVKANVIPVIIGANGTISKSRRQYVSNTPGRHEIKELQKQPYWTLHTYYGEY